MAEFFGPTVGLIKPQQALLLLPDRLHSLQMIKNPTFKILVCSLMCLAPLLLWAQERPQRIVSIGLCTDQLLLMMAERSQIASLSTFAADAQMSYMVDSVADLPLNNASLEAVLPFEPDLVVGTDFAAWDSVRFLRQLGYPVKLVSLPTSIDEIYSMLREFGNWTGNQRNAERMIAQMQQEIRAIQARYASRPRKSIIIYSPNGYTIGANTLENAILEQAGYRNLAAEMGIIGFQKISLERLIAAQPDLLYIDTPVQQNDSLANAYIGHPALSRAVKQQRQVSIPTALRICAGPMITEAIAYMAALR